MQEARRSRSRCGARAGEFDRSPGGRADRVLLRGARLGVRPGTRASESWRFSESRSRRPDSIWAVQAARALKPDGRGSKSATGGSAPPRAWSTTTTWCCAETASNSQQGISNDDDGRGVWSFNGGYEVYRDSEWTLGLLGSYVGSAHIGSARLRLAVAQHRGLAGPQADRGDAAAAAVRASSTCGTTRRSTSRPPACLRRSTSDLGERRVGLGLLPLFADYDYKFETDDVSLPALSGLDLKRARNHSGQEYTRSGSTTRASSETRPWHAAGFRYRHFDSHQRVHLRRLRVRARACFASCRTSSAWICPLSVEYPAVSRIPSSFEDPPGSGSFNSSDRNETTWLFESALEATVDGAPDWVNPLQLPRQQLERGRIRLRSSHHRCVCYDSTSRTDRARRAQPDRET